MIDAGDYYIKYFRSYNKITIYLPQTIETLMNTVSPVRDRKVDLTEADLHLLLSVAKWICWKEEQNEKETG